MEGKGKGVDEGSWENLNIQGSGSFWELPRYENVGKGRVKVAQQMFLI